MDPCDAAGANAMDPWNVPPANKRKAFVATEDTFMVSVSILIVVLD